MYQKLRRIRSVGEVGEGLAWTVDFLAREFSAMRGEKEPLDVEHEDAPIFGMSRRWGMTRNREAMLTPPGKMGYTVLDQKAHRAFIAPGRPRAGAIFVSMEAR